MKVPPGRGPSSSSSLCHGATNEDAASSASSPSPRPETPEPGNRRRPAVAKLIAVNSGCRVRCPSQRHPRTTSCRMSQEAPEAWPFPWWRPPVAGELAPLWRVFDEHGRATLWGGRKKERKKERDAFAFAAKRREESGECYFCGVPARWQFPRAAPPFASEATAPISIPGGARDFSPGKASHAAADNLRIRAKSICKLNKAT